jgi:hypothetical protein
VTKPCHWPVPGPRGKKAPKDADAGPPRTSCRKPPGSPDRRGRTAEAGRRAAAADPRVRRQHREVQAAIRCSRFGSSGTSAGSITGLPRRPTTGRPHSAPESRTAERHPASVPPRGRDTTRERLITGPVQLLEHLGSHAPNRASASNTASGPVGVQPVPAPLTHTAARRRCLDPGAADNRANSSGRWSAGGLYSSGVGEGRSS